MILFQLLGVIVAGYLIGSIPFGLILSKHFSKVDVREHGSGKTGATNVLRTSGKKAAALVLLLDASKGIIAVAVAALIFGRNYMVIGNLALGMLVAQCLAALASMAGHNWSIFLKFKGGRGVATFFGGLIALSPVVGLFGGQVFILGASLTKFASLGSIAGVVGAYSILIPLTIFNGFPIEYLIYTLIGTIVILVMHKDNIVRLFHGKERRIGDKAVPLDLQKTEQNPE